MVYTLIDHKNDAMKCSKLCSETTRLWFHLSFEHFMTSFLWSIGTVDHGKLQWSVC